MFADAVYNVSDFDLRPGFYIKAMNTLACLGLPFNLLGLYAIIRHSPEHLQRIRWQLANAQFWALFQDFLLGFCVTPVVFLPLPAGYTAGLFAQLGITTELQFGMVVAVMAISCSASTHLGLYHWQLVLPNGHACKLPSKLKTMEVGLEMRRPEPAVSPNFGQLLQSDGDTPTKRYRAPPPARPLSNWLPGRLPPHLRDDEETIRRLEASLSPPDLPKENRLPKRGEKLDHLLTPDSDVSTIDFNIHADCKPNNSDVQDFDLRALIRAKRHVTRRPAAKMYKTVRKPHPAFLGKRRITLATCPSSQVKYIHPALHSLLPQIPRFKRILGRPKSPAKMLKRARRALPLPRVLPYYCKNCRLNTLSLTHIIHHNCVKQRVYNQPGHVVQQQRIILGHRCKANGWMALLEQSTKPQRFHLHTYRIDDDMDPIYRGPRTVPPRFPTPKKEREAASNEPIPDSIKIPAHCMCATCGCEFETHEYFDHLAREPKCLAARRPPIPI
ncbi:unnamed protein product, partial [Mesorhabditis spiculigera]